MQKKSKLFQASTFLFAIMMMAFAGYGCDSSGGNGGGCNWNNNTDTQTDTSTGTSEDTDTSTTTTTSSDTDTSTATNTSSDTDNTTEDITEDTTEDGDIDAEGTVYYVSNQGDDSNTGTSSDDPWKTLSRVNGFDFSPGDVVRFERGGTWRGQLIPQSGDATADIVYTSYGSGDKPVLMGSVSKNEASDWEDLGENIWATSFGVGDDAEELIYNGSFDNDLEGWTIIMDPTSEAEASYERVTEDYYSEPASFKLTAANSGNSSWNIYMVSDVLSIEEGKSYQLSFMAKTTSDFRPYGGLRPQEPPYTPRYFEVWQYYPEITTSWTRFEFNFNATQTASDCVMSLYLGETMEAGSSVYIDDISFKELTSKPLEYDIGSVILNNSEVGHKYAEEEDLTTQNAFWYDETDKRIKIYSSDNPAQLYESIELAQKRHIINQTDKSYVEYNNLHLRYGAAHGIGGSNTQNITIRNCDIHYIGGGYLNPGVRYGNGIEFWDHAEDILVEGCEIGNIYDTGLTNQGNGQQYVQRNIKYTGNHVFNCAAAFEIWGGSAGALMEDIYLENNVFENSGYSWSSDQRKTPWGKHILMWYSTAAANNISFTGNTFINSRDYAIETVPTQIWNDIENITVDDNTYIQPEDSKLIRWNNSDEFGGYNANSTDFEAYQNETGNDLNSTLQFP